MMTRREAVAGLAAGIAGSGAKAAPREPMDLILAPSNLGLRPPSEGHEPGAWRMAAALQAAGLEPAFGFRRVTTLERPPYLFEAQAGTRIRNGLTLRRFSETLADAVAASLADGGFPLVVGGDCSNLIGSMAGLRRAGGRGLVHVDGHSDFFHPGNYDTTKRLGTAAGMDLALATGRGEALLTRWPGVDGPLAADADVVQVGEREAADPDYPWEAELSSSAITRIFAQEVAARGVDWAVEKIADRLSQRGIDRAWMHIDLDVLDQAVMPAVDSPGSPGLDFAGLSALISGLFRRKLVAGADVAIYDPELDPDGRYARPIVKALAKGFGRG